MSQVGIPLFYMQELANIGSKLKFRDNFSDESQFWGWRLFMGSETAGKTGVEQNGKYELSVDEGINARWGTTFNLAPRLLMGILTYPCEIITRLDHFSGGISRAGGLFIAESATNVGSSNQWGICQYKGTGRDGVCVIKDDEVVLAETTVRTLPMWLRIRVGCTSIQALNISLAYSLDGVNWITLWTQKSGWIYCSEPSCGVGLYVKNFALATSAVLARFDFFQMTPQSIN